MTLASQPRGRALLASVALSACTVADRSTVEEVAEPLPAYVGHPLRPESDYEQRLHAWKGKLSGDGGTFVVYDVDAEKRRVFRAHATGDVADERGKFPVSVEPAWWDVTPDGSEIWAVGKDGSAARRRFSDGSQTAIATNVGADPLWVEPLWDRESILVATRGDPHGIDVVEWTIDGASATHYHDSIADDVVFDEDLRPRFALQYTEERHGRGLFYRLVRVLGLDGRPVGPAFTQPKWIADRDPTPRIGSGPVHMLGGGSDLSGLFVLDAKGGWTPEWMPRWADATRYTAGPDGVLDAVAEDAERLRWHALTDDGRALADLQQRLGTNVAVRSRSDDDRTWLLDAWSGSVRFAQYVWNRDTDVLSRVGAKWNDRGFEPTWYPVEPLVLTARDGLPIAAYLTRPDEGPGPWPLVVWVHGGPWAGRASWAWSEERQRLADAGYAVLAVDFRGTHGFGWKWVNGTDFLSDEMVNDVYDAMQWAIDKGIADPERIAMTGSSYGGAASLWAAVSGHPRIRCAFAGLTYGNLTTGGGGLIVEAVRTRRWREAHSADRFTDSLSGPVFVWTGAKDGKNPDSIADFVDRAQANGKDVTWVRFTDMGHGNSPHEGDRVAVEVFQSRFLARCLGGSARPATDIPADATFEVRAGTLP